MALRIPVPAATLSAGLDSLVVFGVARLAERRARPPTQLAEPLRRAPLHRRPRVHPARARRPTTPTIAAPATAPTIQGTSAASISRSRGTPGARRQQRAARRHRARAAVRSDPADVRPRRARPRARRPAHAQHEHRAVAGRLGLLPQQHDRHGSRAHAGRPRVGAPALPRSRAQLRSAAGAPLRRAAVRPPAGHVARSVAARRRDAERAGHLAQGHAARAARQRLAPGGGVGGAHRQPAGPAGSRRRSRRRHAHRRALELAIAPATCSAGISCSTCSGSSGSSMADSDPAQIALLQQLGIPWRPRLSRMWNADWHRTRVLRRWCRPAKSRRGRSSSPTTSRRCSPNPTSSS